MAQDSCPKLRLLRMLLDEQQRQEFSQNRFKVSDIMTSHPLTVDGARPLSEAIGLFSTKRVRHVLVVSHFKVVAILSDRDVLKALWKGRENLEQTVKSIATTNPGTASPSTQVDKVASMMFAGRYSAVPIVDNEGMPLGIVTSSDLIWLLRLWQLANNPNKDAVAEQLTQEKDRLVEAGSISDAEGEELSQLIGGAQGASEAPESASP